MRNRLAELHRVALVAAALLAACAEREPAEAPAPQAVAAVVPVAAPPPPPPPPPVAVARFECDGAILHQGIEARNESRIRFWFAVDASMGVAGRLAQVGAPLSLPGADLGGRIAPNFDVDGNLYGGRVELDWPYADGGVTLSLMRETVRRAGKGAGRLVRAIGKQTEQTYLAGKLVLDPASHPRLAELRPTAFVSATCLPGPDLPPPR